MYSGECVSYSPERLYWAWHSDRDDLTLSAFGYNTYLPIVPLTKRGIVYYKGTAFIS